MLFRYSITLTSFFLYISSLAFAQQTATPLKFQKLKSGLEMAYVINKPTSQKPQVGDLIKLNMASVAGNRYLYNSYLQNKGKPAEFGVTEPAFKGDILEAIMMMTVGDSIVAVIDADIVYKNTKQKKPDFIKPGEKMQYFIKLVSIKTKEQVQKEQQANMSKQIKEQLAKQQKDAAKFTAIEEKELLKYFAENKLAPTKTASGLYYIITEEGEGAKAMTNDTVSLNYRGKLIDGTPFDSNIDSLFSHVVPFEFPLGANRVIKGWDEGVALLNKGAKATFYIPSRLGYGAQAMPGNPNNKKGIPANSILIFDVELLNIKPLTK